MRKFILSACSLLALAVGCEQFDPTGIQADIDALEQRVGELEKLCREMNTNITSLQTLITAIENTDYITNVSPVKNGEEIVGYTISFAKAGVVTIYHGKDGVDGTPGQNGTNGTDGIDGHTPVIGVAQDEDGIYYWTVDGAWLLDPAGNKVPTTGKDGLNGSNGAPGQDGKEGITPELKIENGLWYVSYDNGQNWTEIGQATGDQGPQGESGPTGPQGTPGANGDSMFADVNYSNSDYVLFTLSNGEQFKIPTWLAYESLRQQCEQMNSNIDAMSAIVNALRDNDYVTGVAPIYDNGNNIGYVISFSKSGDVTIYHGKDGVDGAPGQNGTNGTDGIDGHTPVIGVAQDVDGIYYWTVDGAWLLDPAGDKVPTTGKDGSNGSNGAPGQDGKEGVTPELKIENGLWYVSYDNGQNWTEIGQATGDQGPQGESGPTGPQGTPGAKGDSFFQSVTQDDKCVYLVLADGTEISVSKVPPVAASLTLDKITGFTATFNGTVIKTSLDLKVTVYYSTTDNLTVYKHKGKVAVTEFDSDAFTLKLTDLAAETTYYYFTEVICDGVVKFTDVDSFRTGKADSYVDWEEGENVGGEI